MKYQNKNLFRYLNTNLLPKKFRPVPIPPYILAFLVLVNFKNLQFEANKPIFEKYDDSQIITYYLEKETNELFSEKVARHSSLITKSLNGLINTVNYII